RLRVSRGEVMRRDCRYCRPLLAFKRAGLSSLLLGSIAGLTLVGWSSEGGARAAVLKEGGATKLDSRDLAVGARELPGRRTATSNTYANPDGSFTTSMFNEPVNFQDPSGVWQPIDNSVVPASD